MKQQIQAAQEQPVDRGMMVADALAVLEKPVFGEKRSIDALRILRRWEECRSLRKRALSSDLELIQPGCVPPEMQTNAYECELEDAVDHLRYLISSVGMLL